MPTKRKKSSTKKKQPEKQHRDAPQPRGVSVSRESTRSEKRAVSSRGREQSHDEAMRRGSSRAVRREPAQPKKKHWMLYILLGVMIAAMVVGGLFVWDRYYRYDDTLDIQGPWTTSDRSVSIFIDEEYINMPEDISYKYQLDTKKKTISFKFADLTGGGTYEFTPDRDTLVISEGSGSDATVVTLVRDESHGA